MCVLKNLEIDTVSRQPVMECTHRNIERCHFTYTTKYKPSQEQICEESFKKICHITFLQRATNETVKRCTRPISKACSGQGPKECRTFYETSCSTKNIKSSTGELVRETSCQKLPVEIRLLNKIIISNCKLPFTSADSKKSIIL